MLKQRYMLVIADATGRPLRRYKVTPRLFVGLASGAGGVLLVMLVVLAHLWTMREDSSLARGVRSENAQLDKLTQRLESRLPVVQKLARTTEATFDQVWSKSSLGRDPGLLPEGASATDAGGDAPVILGPDTPPAGGHAPGDAKSSRHVKAAADGSPADGKAADGQPPSGSTSPGAQLASSEDFAILPDKLDDIEHRMLRLQGTLGETIEYYHDAAQLLANTPSIRPTRSPWLSSSFGKRIDPIYGYWVMHKGLDMPGHIGMEVMAPADGVVIWTGWRGGYGQTVVIDHGYGLQTHFAHLSAYTVQVGTHVRRGDQVARMGSTGKSTGPHLHYEVRRLGQPMDPRRFILD